MEAGGGGSGGPVLLVLVPESITLLFTRTTIITSHFDSASHKLESRHGQHHRLEVSPRLRVIQIFTEDLP